MLTTNLKVGRPAGVTEYTVRHYPHGMAVFGAWLAVDDVVGLIAIAEKRGYDQLHMGIALSIGAHSVMTSKESGEKWAAEINGGTDWLHGTDTGISARTIWAVMTGDVQAFKGFDPDAPRDPDDFGRCHRLLKLKPEWLPRLQEVADKYPAWGPLVKEWDQLAAIYERDVATGKSEELYARMTALREAR